MTVLHGIFYVFCLFWITKHAVDSVQLSAPEEVTGAYGGSVTVSCQYDLKYKDHTKYWCKGQIYDFCTIVVKTPRNRDSDRSFIADDKDAGLVTVKMTYLRKEDDGMYWCVIATAGRNIHTGVWLHISDTVITTTTPTASTASTATTTPTEPTEPTTPTVPTEPTTPHPPYPPNPPHPPYPPHPLHHQ